MEVFQSNICLFQTLPLEGITKIGEPLSILIFLSDQGEGRFDVKAQVIQLLLLTVILIHLCRTAGPMTHSIQRTRPPPRCNWPPGMGVLCEWFIFIWYIQFMKYLLLGIFLIILILLLMFLRVFDAYPNGPGRHIANVSFILKLGQCLNHNLE